MGFYERLVGLYPADVRFAYGAEMLDGWRRGHAERRARGRLRLAAFVARSTASTLLDALAERVNLLYSHRSFHTRGKPNAGVVRPPNMSKREWFGMQ